MSGRARRLRNHWRDMRPRLLFCFVLFSLHEAKRTSDLKPNDETIFKVGFYFSIPTLTRIRLNPVSTLKRKKTTLQPKWFESLESWTKTLL